MLLPTILPRELAIYSSAETDTELFDELLKKPIDLINFIIHACEDETWSEEHHEFMQAALEWLSFRSVEGRLSLETLQKLTDSIQPHFNILKPYLVGNVSILIKDKKLEVNSILLAASSDFFRDLFRSHYKGDPSIHIQLDQIPFAIFKKIEMFMNTGTIEDIWKYSEKELIALLNHAKRIHLPNLIHLCEESIKRYINKANVLDYLILSIQKSWELLRIYCSELINNFPWDVKIDSDVEDLDQYESNPVYFEFLAFSGNAIEIFNKLSPYITHLICSGTLTEEAFFTTAIRSCPKLFSVDVSRSHAYSDQFVNLPYDLQALDLSRCPWLTNGDLRKIISFCPQLKKIGLASDSQITFIGWAELEKLRDLRSLNIARSHHLHDEDFTLILRASSLVTQLDLSECRHLTDRSFFDLARHLPLLAILNVSRTNISDESLLEISAHCSHLRILNIARCKQISERGFLQIVKQAIQLEQLNIKNCSISDETIKSVKILRPRLLINS